MVGGRVELGGRPEEAQLEARASLMPAAAGRWEIFPRSLFISLLLLSRCGAAEILVWAIME